MSTRFLLLAAVCANYCAAQEVAIPLESVATEGSTIPAAVVLVWEGMNVFLPAALKKISVIFYLQSLSPVVAPPDANMPALQKLLVTAAEPVPAAWAVLGLMAVTVLVLAVAARKARKLEVNYSTD